MAGVAIRIAGTTAIAAALIPLLAVSPARADLQLCNRTSYVLDLALGLETRGAAATRGWFRVDPGQCRAVLQGAIEAEHVYVHTRPHAAYREPPLPQAKHAELCIQEGNFIIAGARKCPSAGQRIAPFTEVKPSEVADALVANVSEEAEYTPEQARLAGVQRLLVIAGYDAEPIDGLEGRKTEAALAQFLKDRKLAAGAVETPALFDALLEAARQAEGTGVTWCNDTGHAVMAALGTEEKAGIVTRGWYRVATGRCLKPEIAGKPGRLFSFAEAIDEDGRAIRRGDRPLAWGGPVVLCTRDLKFEIAEHQNCADRGLTATGFAAVDLTNRSGITLRFKE